MFLINEILILINIKVKKQMSIILLKLSKALMNGQNTWDSKIQTKIHSF